MSIPIVTQAKELNRAGKFAEAFDLLAREMPGVAERFDGTPAEREEGVAAMTEAARELCKDPATENAVESFRREVEKKAGIPVRIERDETLQTTATVQFAKLHKRDFHRIAWNGESAPWGALATQLEGLSLWIDGDAAGRCLVLLNSPGAFHAFRTELDADVKKLFAKVDFARVPQILKDLHLGVVHLLWSVPHVLFASARLCRERPELRPAVFLSLLSTVEANAADVRSGDRAPLIPGRVKTASRILDLLLSVHLSALFGADLSMSFNPRVADLRKADELYALFREADAGFRPGDQDHLCQKLAEALGIRSWIAVGPESEYVLKATEEEKESVRQDEKARAEIRRFLQERMRDPRVQSMISLYMLGALEDLKKRPRAAVHEIAEWLADRDAKGISLDSVYRYQIPDVNRESSGYETLSWLYAAFSLDAPEKLPLFELPFEKAWEQTLMMFRQRNPGQSV